MSQGGSIVIQYCIATENFKRIPGMLTPYSDTVLYCYRELQDTWYADAL
jgi:hypothetical protein